MNYELILVFQRASVSAFYFIIIILHGWCASDENYGCIFWSEGLSSKIKGLPLR